MAIGIELFSYLTFLDTTTLISLIFSPSEMISLKIWERLNYSKYLLPVFFRGKKNVQVNFFFLAAIHFKLRHSIF